MTRKNMAVNLISLYLLAVVLSHEVASYRPFSQPKRLFKPQDSDPSIAEGVRRISRRDLQSGERSEHSNEFSKFVDSWKHRTRRSTETTDPAIGLLKFELSNKHDTLYVHWSGTKESGSETVVALTKDSSPTNLSTTDVFVTHDYGRHWNTINHLLKCNGKQAVIDQFYTSKANFKLYMFTDIRSNCLFISEDDAVSFTTYFPLDWQPSYLSLNPRDDNLVFGYDKKNQHTLHFSKDRGKTWIILKNNVHSFYWAVPKYKKIFGDVVTLDDEKTLFIEYSPAGKNLSTVVMISDYDKINVETVILEDVEDFEVVENFLIASKPVPGVANDADLMVNHNRTKSAGKFMFTTAEFSVKKNAREYFIADATEDQLFITINHQKNLSNLYTSDVQGWKFTLSLVRILYHNPDTDISTKWLREAVQHRFVDLHKIESMRGVYIATQLTPGAVGSRHLKSLITYNKGGKWQYVRAPTVDSRGRPMMCRYPFCSLHVNLKFGSVYRYSPTEMALSKSSAPGIIIASAVANTNLKINPDSYISADGGVTWRQILRGKHHFLICNYGGLLVTTPFNTPTNYVQYSLDLGYTWKQYNFANKSVYVNELLTEPGEHTAVVSLYGTYSSAVEKNWLGVHINFTDFLGPKCKENQYVMWSPSDGRSEELCFLGRVEKFKRRNRTEKCFSEFADVNPKVQDVCNCTRQDFMCDIGYEANEYDSGCTRAQGWDYKLSQVPDSCAAGKTYFKSRGFRKIPDDPCVNGAIDEFMPYEVPCPTERLEGVQLQLVTPNPKMGRFYPVETNTAVQLSVKFTNERNMTGVDYSWDFGDGHTESGEGKDFKDLTHTFTKADHYTVLMVVTNQMSYVSKTAEVIVQEPLPAGSVTIVSSPSTLTANEESYLVAHVENHRATFGTIVYKWTIEDKVISTWQSVLKYIFKEVKSYTVKLTAMNFVSQVDVTKTILVSKDFMPTNVKVSANSASSLDVSWDPPLEPGSLVNGYQIMYMEDGSDTWKSESVASDVQTYLLKGLKAYTVYLVKIATITVVATGKPTAVQRQRTLESVPGSPPTSVVVNPTGQGQLVMTWIAPNSTDIHGTLTGYEINWWRADFSVNQVVTINDPTQTRNVFSTGLQQNTNYVFQVAAKTSKGRGPFSKRVFYKTPVGKPELAPGDLSSVSLNGSCQLISWDVPNISPDDNRPFPVKNYQIIVNPGNRVLTTVKTKIQICGLSPFTSYTLGVSATSEQGVGKEALLTFRTRPTEPGAPQQVQAKAVSSTSVKISWKPPKVTNGQLESYEVHQVDPPKILFWTVSEQEVTITNLKPFVTYSFSVAAKNVGEKQGASVKVNVKTMEDKPGPPASVTVEPVDPKSASARVLWSPPLEANGEIITYLVSWVADTHKSVQYSEVVPGTKNSYVVKYLQGLTQYSFYVAARTNAGDGPRFIRKTIQYTATPPSGTKRYTIGPFTGSPISGTIDKTMLQWKFVESFAQKIVIANSERVAGIIVNDDHTVQFDILGSTTGPSVDTLAKHITLITTLVVEDLNAPGDSLKEIEIKNTGPVSHAQHSNQVVTAQNSTAIILGIIFAIAILILLFVSAFFYRKFKALDNNYSKFSGQYHRETENVQIDSNGFDDEDGHDLRIIEPPQARQPFKKRRKDKAKDDDMKPLSDHMMLDEEDHILA